MKRITMVFIFLAFFSITHDSSAVNLMIEPYVKGGGIKLEENGISEGHKFILAGGIKTYITPIPVLRGIIRVEKWQMGEGLDEDTEIPRKGYSITGDIEYQMKQSQEVKLYPYTGITFEEIKRAEGNAKIPGSWDLIKCFIWNMGGKISYKNHYIKAGILFPFGIDSNKESHLKSKVGYDVEVGVNIWKKLMMGFFYRQLKFRDPGVGIDVNGLMTSYQF